MKLSDSTMLKPTKIVCIGLNYHDHAQELGLQLPTDPLIFLKPPSSLIYENEKIIYPKIVKQLDYEAELAVVIGRTAVNVSKEDAYQYIQGYTVANDVTARDLQKLDGQWTRAKSFDTFCPVLNQYLWLDNVNSLQIKSYLNGQLCQNSNTDKMIFKVDQIIAFVSSVMTLNPGDLVLTGTPMGIGPMQRGDVITVEIEKIGQLTNTVG